MSGPNQAWIFAPDDVSASSMPHTCCYMRKVCGMNVSEATWDMTSINFVTCKLMSTDNLQ